MEWDVWMKVEVGGGRRSDLRERKLLAWISFSWVSEDKTQLPPSRWETRGKGGAPGVDYLIVCHGSAGAPGG